MSTAQEKNDTEDGKQETIDTTVVKSDVEKSISFIRENATYWKDKRRRELDLIQYYTLAATLVMATNLFLKENIKNVGGWIPFCLAGTLLTAVATWLLNRLRSEDATRHCNSCFELLSQYETF